MSIKFKYLELENLLLNKRAIIGEAERTNSSIWDRHSKVYMLLEEVNEEIDQVMDEIRILEHKEGVLKTNE